MRGFVDNRRCLQGFLHKIFEDAWFFLRTFSPTKARNIFDEAKKVLALWQLISWRRGGVWDEVREHCHINWKKRAPAYNHCNSNAKHNLSSIAAINLHNTSDLLQNYRIKKQKRNKNWSKSNQTVFVYHYWFILVYYSKQKHT